MSKAEIKLPEYFKRIRLPKIFKPKADLKTLSLLHFAHVSSIPFENLDIHLGKKISIDEEDIFKKIVNNSRGGYCYEMNGLFYVVLKEIGFKVDFLMARMMYGFNTVKHRSHQIISVQINGKKYIADAGYRNGLSYPIELKANKISKQNDEEFKILKDIELGFILKKKVNSLWVNVYTFTPEKYLPIDFTALNYYNSTSPESAFTQRILASIKTLNGSYTLIDKKFVTVHNLNITEKSITSALEYRKLFKEIFGMSIPKKDCEILFNKLK